VVFTIEIHELTKRYGPATAVSDLMFTVRPGTVTGFLGPNGAGKPRYGIVTFIVARVRSLGQQEIGLGQRCGMPFPEDAVTYSAAGVSAACI
jgi:ABC-type lipopolysaccharide export system ATPase subunit